MTTEPMIKFDPDGVAWVSSRTVEEAMRELAAYSHLKPDNRRPRAARELGITIEQLEAAEDFARDAWCTPGFVADELPEYSRLCDPCSNPRSLVLARWKYMLERGENGLSGPWQDLVYVNAGFSNLMPWTIKLTAERANIDGAAFMCNVDNSTAWWQSLTDQLDCVLLFKKRLPFIPHPGIPKSGNNKPQALIGDRAFFDECKPGLFEFGEMYEKTRARSRRAA